MRSALASSRLLVLTLLARPLTAQDTSTPRLGVTGGQNRATASWSSVTGAAGYKLSRRAVVLDATGRVTSAEPWAVIATQTATSYADLLPKPSTLYEYRVDAGLTTGQVASSTVVPYGTPPFTTATNLVITGAADRATVSWGAATAVTGYQIWRRTVNHDGTVGNLGQRGSVPATVTSFSDVVGLTGTVYEYQVVSTDASGGSWPTGWVRFMAPVVVAPVVTVTGAADRSALSWSATTGASGYQVTRTQIDATGRAVSAPVQLTATPITATSFTDAVPAPLTAYQYGVTAVMTDGSTLASQPVGYVTPAFTTPGNVMVAGAGGRMGITWCAATGVSGYQVWRREVRADGTVAQNVQRTTSPLTVPGFTDDITGVGGAIEYQVIGLGLDGRHWPSPWVRPATAP